MVRININFQIAERLQGLIGLPRETFIGLYRTLAATALSPLSLLNVASSRKMKGINNLTYCEFHYGSLILRNIYMKAMVILKPNSFSNCEIQEEYIQGSNQYVKDKLNDIAERVASTKGIDVRNRFRYLTFGVHITGLQSYKFLIGSASLIASIPFPSSSKTFKKLNKHTIRCSSSGELPTQLYLATLGIIKPKASARLTNDYLFPSW